MKYYLIAGEASGDLHGANLIKALRRQDEEAVIRCWGGERMKEAGGELVKHYRDTAYMGFLEVITHLPEIFQHLDFCKRDLIGFDPDVIILIDYPGFNIRIAQWAKNQKIRAGMVYYISPQVWAWKAKRVHILKKVVDLMLVILPFEAAFYRRYGFEVTYVGHPLVDHLNSLSYPVSLRDKYHLDGRKIIALLPGSRQQEIKKVLPLLLEMVPLFPDHQFVVAAMTSVHPDIYQLAGKYRCKVIFDDTNLMLYASDAAVVASGTATLECALMGVPQVVVYRGSSLTYHLAKRLIRVPYISLVNLIVNRALVPELIQSDFNIPNLQNNLQQILSDPGKTTIRAGYQEIQQLLGKSEASTEAATAISKLMQSKARRER